MVIIAGVGTEYLPERSDKSTGGRLHINRMENRMKRYHVYLDYNYHGPELVVEEEPTGEWVKFSDVNQRIEDIEHLLESSIDAGNETNLNIERLSDMDDIMALVFDAERSFKNALNNLREARRRYNKFRAVKPELDRKAP